MIDFNKMSLQEMFDKASSGLLAQGKKCIANCRCSYRGDRGEKCAIGFLISDEEYHMGLEGDDIAMLVEKEKILANDDIQEFLRDLQKVHDYYDSAEWNYRFKDLAENWNLTFKARE